MGRSKGPPSYCSVDVCPVLELIRQGGRQAEQEQPGPLCSKNNRGMLQTLLGSILATSLPRGGAISNEPEARRSTGFTSVGAALLLKAPELTSTSQAPSSGFLQSPKAHGARPGGRWWMSFF